MYVEIIKDMEKNISRAIVHFNGNVKEETISTVNIKSFKEIAAIMSLYSGNIPDEASLDDITEIGSDKEGFWDFVVKGIYDKHLEMQTPEAVDYREKFLTPVDGTSRLIRLNSAKIIKIAYRTGKAYTSSDCVCIDNVLREKFFADVKRSKGFKKSGKYYIDGSLDSALYEQWAKILEEEYKNQLNQIYS